MSWLYCNTMTGCCYFRKFISISKYLVPTICQVSFDILGKHSQHSKNKNTRTTPKQKYSTNNRKSGEETLRYSCEGFDIGFSLENSGSMLFSQLKGWCQSEITSYPWLYYRINSAQSLQKPSKVKLLLPLEQNHFLQVWYALEEENLQRVAHHSH